MYTKKQKWKMIFFYVSSAKKPFSNRRQLIWQAGGQIATSWCCMCLGMIMSKKFVPPPPLHGSPIWRIQHFDTHNIGFLLSWDIFRLASVPTLAGIINILAFFNSFQVSYDCFSFMVEFTRLKNVDSIQFNNFIPRWYANTSRP